MANVTLRGKEQNTIGDLPAVGSKAPDFSLTTSSLKDVTLQSFEGKKKLLYILPSLDTPVCAKTTKQLNELMASVSHSVACIVSADLPFAQGRFCGIEKLKNITVLSMMRSKKFAKDYGVLLVDGPLAGVTARAVVVLDEDNTVLYSDLIKEISDDPDFSNAIAALR